MSSNHNTQSNYIKKWPHSLKLGTHNWIPWKKLFDGVLIAFHEPGHAILQSVPLDFSLPTIDDLYPSTSTYKYEHEVDLAVPEIPANTTLGTPRRPPRTIRTSESKWSSLAEDLSVTSVESILYTLCAAGLSSWDAAVTDKTKIITRWNHISDDLISVMLDALEQPTLESAELEPTWKALIIASNSYGIHALLQKKFSGEASTRIIQKRTIAGIVQKQTTTCQAFANDILDSQAHVKIDLGGPLNCTYIIHYNGTVPIGETQDSRHNASDFIKINDLFNMVYLEGLNKDEFGGKLNAFHHNNPTGRLKTPLLDIINEYTKYSLFQCQAVNYDKHGESSVSLLTDTTNSKVGPDPSPQPNLVFNKDKTQTKCVDCAKFFPNKPAKTPGRFNVHCPACAKAFFDSKRSPGALKTPSASPPSAKDIAAAKALLASLDTKDPVASLLTGIPTDSDDLSSPTTPFDDSDFSCSFMLAAAPSRKVTAGYWDSGCTFNATWTLALVVDPIPITSFQVGSSHIDNPIVYTHRGTLAGIDHPCNVVFYCASLQTTLFSVGLFLKHDYTFELTKINGICYQLVHTPSGDSFSKSVMGKNNLFRIPDSLLSPAQSLLASTQHFTREQRQRIEDCRALHIAKNHPSDEFLIAALRSHSLGNTHLTAQDVLNMSNYLPPCLGCIQSKLKSDSFPTSTTSPCTQIGEHVSFDLNILPVPTTSGNTQEITSIDEFSQFGHVIPLPSKETAPLVVGLLTLKSSYSAASHHLTQLLSDSEPSITSARPFVEASIPIGTMMTFAPPLEHCKRVERFIQTVGNRITSTLNDLPFILPAKYEIYVKRDCVYNLNTLPNSNTIDKSPYQLFYNGATPPLHKKHPFLRFGTVCVVEANELTSKARAALTASNPKYVLPTELGVVFGTDRAHPFCYMFLVQSGRVIFRKNITPVDRIIPFNWTPRNLPLLVSPTDPPVLTVMAPINSIQSINSDSSVDHLSSDQDESDLWTTSASLSEPVAHRTRSTTSKGAILLMSLDHQASFLAEIDPPLVHNDYTLYPPTKVKDELSVSEALLHPAAPTLRLAIDKEFYGLQELVPALAKQPTAWADIPKNAVLLPSKLFLKPRPLAALGWKARFALGGNRQPPDSFGEIFAGMADSGSTMLVLALCQAHAFQHKYRLVINGSDIPIAYPKCPTTPENCPRPIYVKIQNNVPHPLAGQWLAVTGLIYGLKQSNHVFDKEETAVILSAGFTATLADPHIFIRRNPSNPLMYCIHTTHVDDGRTIFSESAQCYYDELLAAHTKRWGPLTLHEPITDFLAQEYHIDPAGPITLTMSKYHAKVLIKAGAQDLKISSNPASADLFKPSDDLTPFDKTKYQSLIGNLIFPYAIRHDYKMVVGYLARFNLAPTVGDYNKLIHLYRYVKGTVDLGVTLHSTSGFQLSVQTDASFACHSNGRSQCSFGIYTGNCTAPTFTHTSMEIDDYSLNPHQSEFNVYAKAAKKLIEFEHLSNELGFQQQHPLEFRSDNIPALALSEAPEVSRKSRYFNNKVHYLRDLVKSHHIKGVHIDTDHNSINLMTHPVQGSKFIFERDTLMNVAARRSDI